ncbi:MAG: thioredoxin [Candidatus Latescibacterota bacterium]|nr:MAG: thioredoxin [Candidatus Latescibacterota bacterium]
MAVHELKDVADENFDDEVRRSKVPVVIDFWAPWCEPCKLVHPILQRMAEKYEGSVKFYRMNVDEEKAKPSEYAVRSIPTLLFFKDGTIKNQMIGVQTEDNIDKAIKSLL